MNATAAIWGTGLILFLIVDFLTNPARPMQSLVKHLARMRTSRASHLSALPVSSYGRNLRLLQERRSAQSITPYSSIQLTATQGHGMGMGYESLQVRRVRHVGRG